MFNTSEWTGIIERTYGYKSCSGEFEGRRIYYSKISNDIGEYSVSPPFGDFISLSDIKPLEALVSKSSSDKFRFKICADNLSLESDLFKIKQITF